MNTRTHLINLASRLVLCLILLAAVIGPMALTRVAHASGPYVVNVAYDGPDSNLSDGACYDGVSGCPLRAAIQQASYDGVATTINFDSSLAGIQLYLSNTYGSLIVSGSNIYIDGYTGPGNYPPLVNGSNLVNKNVIEIQGNYNTLYYLVVRSAASGHGIYIHDPSGSGYASYNTLDYLIVYDNAQSGIVVSGDAGGGGYGNTIAHSLIGGANWAQTTCPGDGNGWEGIEIKNGADNTNINSNEIVCNGNSGVWLNGSTGGQIASTAIQTNKVGTDGVNDMGNGMAGIEDTQASGTIVYNNQISGNGNDGVLLQGSTSAALTTNRIGLAQDGNTALPNGYSGVAITNGASGNTLGSPTDANGKNVISGNSRCGVEILTGANNNALYGNYIGLGADGSTVIPNGEAGVAIIGASNNALSSGLNTDPPQFIAGNTREGVYIENTDTTYINWKTYIGVATNMSTAKPNGLEGVKVNGATHTVIRPGSVIYNSGAGIVVVGALAAGNTFVPEVILNNGGLPIDLGDDGHTVNDLGDGDTGPNALLNYPEVNMMGSGGFSGFACAGCAVYFYQAIRDPTAAGGGGVYLSSVFADVTTGDFAYTFPVGVSAVAMVACDPITNNCSEMSPSVVNTAATGYKIYLPIIRR